MKPFLPENVMTITPVVYARHLSLEELKQRPSSERAWDLADLRAMDSYERQTNPEREKMKAWLYEQ